MNKKSLVNSFKKMSARIEFSRPSSRSRLLNNDNPISVDPVLIDIKQDRKGEFFELTCDDLFEGEILVTNIIPEKKHLLLLIKDFNYETNSKFLCGHDERHWFVAAVPENKGVTNVKSAMEALKPDSVINSQQTHKIRVKNRNRRKNRAFLRQGEWFFIPVSDKPIINPNLILKNEPIQRSNGSPHFVEEVYRSGGETVRVNSAHRNGITEKEYKKLIQKHPSGAKGNWRIMKRGARVLARGKVRHSDHATIVLNGWHEVVMNTESNSLAMGNVAFLD